MIDFGTERFGVTVKQMTLSNFLFTSILIR